MLWPAWFSSRAGKRGTVRTCRDRDPNPYAGHVQTSAPPRDYTGCVRFQSVVSSADDGPGCGRRLTPEQEVCVCAHRARRTRLLPPRDPNPHLRATGRRLSSALSGRPRLSDRREDPPKATSGVGTGAGWSKIPRHPKRTARQRERIPKNSVRSAYSTSAVIHTSLNPAPTETFPPTNPVPALRANTALVLCQSHHENARS